jgi:integrase
VSKVNLTDRFIKSRKRARAGQRDDYPDALVPGLALRVTELGHKSFVLIARYPANPIHPNPTHPARRPLGHPTRRALVDYGALSLEQAREKARHWLQLISKGVDPKIESARERAAAQRRQANNFAAVAAAFLERHAARLRKSDEAKRIIECEFVNRWGGRPITDIRSEEVAGVIRTIVKRGAPYQAHNALGYIRRLFNWAIGTNEFGIETSPVERLKPKDLIGEKEARNRVLTDAELRSVWEAADATGYPYGPMFKMLILTGQRENEVAGMRWSEVDLDKMLWTIATSRMKGGRAHEVPLTGRMRALLESLPDSPAGTASSPRRTE